MLLWDIWETGVYVERHCCCLLPAGNRCGEAGLPGVASPCLVTSFMGVALRGLNMQCAADASLAV